MSSKSHNRITVAKHVYLRTQQRRLRHVKCIIIRNLTLPESLEASGAPLNIRIYFTLHPLYDESKVLYRSDTVCQSYNPTWESVQFTSATFGSQSSLHFFTIKVWFQLTSNRQFPSPKPVSRALFLPSSKTKDDSMKSKEEHKELGELAFEGTVDLSDLVYLGSLVNKDGSSYPPNSVVIGMFDGYFSNPAVGGIPPSPPIAHSLVDLLPPRSLLEVNKTDVMDSYINSMLQMILSKQEKLNRVTREANASKARVESYLREKEVYFRKKKENERLKMRVGLLQRQLQQRERLEKEECERDDENDELAKKIEADLRQRQDTLREKELRYQLEIEQNQKNREKLQWTRKCRTLRQRNMIYDLCETFVITGVAENNFTICKVILPNADCLDQTNSMEQYGVALGYTAHLVSQLAHVLQVPLQYPIKPYGSKSTISDHISEEVVIDTIKEFPLYWKGTEKALFQYAVHLLNKDIGQLRQHCGYPGSRTMLKKTLPNLKILLDKLIKDYFLSPPPSSAHQPGQPMTSNASDPMDASSSIGRVPDNDRLLDYSSYSSRNSSLATTMTLGLSPTPTLPSPHASVDHESFHSLVQTSSPSTPSQMSSLNSFDDYGEGGLVMKMGRNRGRGSDSSGGSRANGSVDDDFMTGFYRTRSNHIGSSSHVNSGPSAGNNNNPNADSSTHEHLHYTVPVTTSGVTTVPPAMDSEVWRRMDMVLRQNMASASSTSTAEGGLDQNLEEIEEAGKNGDCEPVFVPLQHPSTDPSRTPTPPSSLQNPSNPNGAGEYMICKLDSRHRDSSECSSSTAGGEYATVDSKHSAIQDDRGNDEDDEAEWERVEYDPHITGDAAECYARRNRTRDTIKKLKTVIHSESAADSESREDGDRRTANINYPEPDIARAPGGTALDEQEQTCLDQNRQRSSPLVGTKELHDRRARVNSREHNLLPSPPGVTPEPSNGKLEEPGRVVFSPKGFSALSSSGEDVIAATREDTGRGVIPHPVTGVEWMGSGVNENGKGSSRPQALPDSRTTRDKTKVVEMSYMAAMTTSSPHPLSDSPRTHFSSTKDHPASSQALTNASPPLAPMAPTSPDPALHFHRPRGYALRNRGMSTPHVVGMKEAGHGGEEDYHPNPTASDNGASTNSTHQGFGGSDRDGRSLEDWIDRF